MGLACGHIHRVNSRKKKGSHVWGTHLRYQQSQCTLDYVARQCLKKQNNKRKTDVSLSCLNWNRDEQGVQGGLSLRISGLLLGKSLPLPQGPGAYP